MDFWGVRAQSVTGVSKTQFGRNITINCSPDFAICEVGSASPEIGFSWWFLSARGWDLEVYGDSLVWWAKTSMILTGKAFCNTGNEEDHSCCHTCEASYQWDWSVVIWGCRWVWWGMRWLLRYAWIAANFNHGSILQLGASLFCSMWCVQSAERFYIYIHQASNIVKWLWLQLYGLSQVQVINLSSQFSFSCKRYVIVRTISAYTSSRLMYLINMG